MKQLFLISLLGLFVSCTSSQDTAKTQAVAQMVDAQEYIFIAETALPLGGKSIYLTSTYSLQVKNDSLQAYLPYFGRAYVAPINPAQGGIQFDSENFTYNSKKKKDGWLIELETKDQQRNYKMLLDISSSGYAHLSVNSYDRQTISFNSYIESIGKK
ncbi:MAG: DUF4251 domain-containing protein [Candidatus Azobacteroides sp.]|nr:DUF4251 domain-containing protein [Candidatus Azobacteroides sp.]